MQVSPTTTTHTQTLTDMAANGAAVPADAPLAAPLAAPPSLPAALPAAPSVPNPGIVGPPGSNSVHVRLLGINDFHGQIGDNDAKNGAMELGGAATLAGYINRERSVNPAGTVLLSVGDAIGASPPESTLLKHESTMAVLAGMGVNLATLGNHEFDGGYAELMRLILGGSKATKKGAPPWPGSPFPWLSANLLDKKSGKPILPPYVIMKINGVNVAFIGAVTKNLRNVTISSAVKNLDVLDPATAINRYIPEIQKQGVHAIVAFMHEGGTPNEKGEVEGPIVDIAKRLDPDVDVVMSAHSHREYATKIHGKIVTQGSSYAKALAEIDLAIDPKTGHVVAGSSRIIHNDQNGVAPDPLVGKLAGMFQEAVSSKTQRVISELPGPVTRKASPAGESALGTLIAEAQRQFARTDIAVMNPGGIRQDLTSGGPVTWGKLFGVQPFNNHVMRTSMTGKQIMAMLEEMFRAPGKGHDVILQVAGMRVWIDPRKPLGKRITKVVTDDGKKLDLMRTYTVALNAFLAQGGDGFVSLGKLKKPVDVGSDLAALVAYLSAGKPVPTAPVGRLNLVGGSKLAEPAH